VEKHLFFKKIAYTSKIVAIIFFTLVSIGLSAQINGTVSDSDSGELLIGVNVVIKGKDALGAISNFDGTYTINATVGDSIVFSYVGYESKTYYVGLEKTINAILSESSQLLEEIVVVGYGAVDKKDLTGVVTKIGEGDFIKGTISSPEKLLNGKVAGLQISNNGEPGGGTRMRLRGGTSLDASSSPLIVIDGVPIDSRGNASERNPLNFVNASDVADITILKDASAAAIYGSRGANGVIIITTRSGKEGKMKINYNGQGNMSIFSGNTTVLSPNNFRNAIIDKAPQEIEYLGDASTRWVDEVTQNAFGMDHNLSFSGGTKKFNYMISGGYLNNNGVLKTTNHVNKSLSANLTAKLLDDALTISLKSKSGLSNDRFAPNVMGAALTFDPTRPVFDADSKYGGYYQWKDPLAVNNPVSTLDLTNETGQSTRLLNNLSLSYNLPFLKGLSFNSNLGYDYTIGKKRNLRDPLLKDGDVFNRNGYLFNEDLRNYSALIETYGIYKTKFKSINSGMELTFGHSWQETDRENRWEEGNGLEMIGGEYAYTTDIRKDSFLVQNRLISFFGRANFTVNDKYLLTASVRRDGSSRFGAENKWGLFPAVAFGWRILEEDFAEGLNNVFTNLKLRISYGVTGNEDIQDFLYTTFYKYGTADASYQFGDEFVRTLRGDGVDPGIKWEETSSLNFGIDFGFWDNRISGTVDVYQKNTNDLLFTVVTSAFTNLSDRILSNIGEMENKGIELSLNSVILDRKNLQWDLGFNASYNQNKITKLDNNSAEQLANFQGYETGGISGDVGQNIQILKVGQSVETFNTYKHILLEDGKPVPDTYDRDGNGILNLLDMYEDLNEDGLINENDLTVNQSAAPDFIFGLSTNLRYKNWDFTAVIRSHIGNYVYNNVSSSTGYFERLTDRVTNNIDASAYKVHFKTKQLKSDYYIENASFAKLDNITIGYNIQKAGFLESVRIFATVSNVFTLTNYSGLDPELPQFMGGIDNNIYPVSRNILLGLNINF